MSSDAIQYMVGHQVPVARPLVPFDPGVCDFLNDLSAELRAAKEASAYSDVMSFAFWCRRANITALKEDYDDGRVRLGLGLVFHITPSNVPINFAFSFAFGLLSGNANLVRMPSKQFPQVDVVCTAICRLFETGKYDEIRAMTAFVRYAQNEDVTAGFSANCSARVIWGGDVAIRAIRKWPIPERAVEIAFSDRYSFCMIDAAAVLSLDEAGLNRLAESFYNDTYVMDQNACSSPHLIVWSGEGRSNAQEKFWTAVGQVVSKKYQLEAVHAVDKYMLLCRDAIESEQVCYFKQHGHVYRIGLKQLPANLTEIRGKCGYFYEYDMRDDENLSGIVTNKYQTLTYFGIDKAQLRDFVVENRLAGIDRVVPIGRALDMGTTWDGYDVVKTLSRIVDVR